MVQRNDIPDWQTALDAARSAPRCGAKTRSGRPCEAPRVRGKTRCRMHGCGRGSGAPVGNRNAWVHGQETTAIRQWKRQQGVEIRYLVRMMRLLKMI